MKFGGARGRNLLLLIALLATLVVLGCWDNRAAMQRVLDQGYATTAQVTGAQFQRTMPFAADGWRPRFVEQDLSVDLGWKGKDGKAHEHKKVPVTDGFARTIVSGDQVRLVTLPVKVLDDDTAVPVITADTTARLASLQSWLSIAGYIALAAWAGFAASSLFGRRQAAGISAAAKPIDIPPRRTLLGLVLLVVGGFMAFQAWSEEGANDPLSVGGKDIVAEITDASSTPSHAVRLSWKDGQGSVHHFGPTRSARRSGTRSPRTANSACARRRSACATTTRPRGRSWSTMPPKSIGRSALPCSAASPCWWSAPAAWSRREL